MDLLADVLIDSIKDTAELVPFLFVTYLAIEALEHASNGAAERAVSAAGKAGPVVGALLGAVPQCGFSAMAATLYAGGVVTVGTLVAVILSTSDELVPVFLAHGDADRLVGLLAFKVVVGLVVGLAVDATLRATHQGGIVRNHGSLLAEEHAHSHEDGSWHHILRSAASHTAQVTLFIFVFTVLFDLLIEGIGEDVLATVLGRHPVRATFLAGLVGLVPSCGASVIIAELYLAGTLAAGPMVAGLLVSGGVGLLVLFRTNGNIGQNLGISAFVYVVGVACGLAVGASGIIF